MANELGEIAVDVKQEGAQDAVESIGEASSDTGQEGEGGLAGPGAGEALGDLGSKLGKILGLLAVVSQVEVITELLSGLLRAVNLALLPLAGLLLTFLRPIFQELLSFIGSIDFQTTLDEFLRKTDVLISSLLREFKGFVDELIPFLDITGDDPDSGSTSGPQFTTPTNPDNFRSGPLGFDIRRDSFAEDISISMGWLKEKSNSSQDQSIGETATEEVRNGGSGGT